MKRILALLPLLLFVFGCHQAPETSPISAEEVIVALDEIPTPPPMDQDAPPPPPPRVDQETSDPIQAKPAYKRKLIKRGEIRFGTSGIRTTESFIQNLLPQYDAYIARSNQSSSSWQREQCLLVRIPAGNFDAFLHSLQEGIGEPDMKNIEVEDVTMRYHDLKARLKTKKAVEKRYTELLSKAKTVEDILKIESQIAELREEIDATEGSFRLLANHVSYSSLLITFYEKIDAEEAPGFGSRITKSLANGWNGIVEVFIGIMNIWPVLLILTGIVIMLMRFRARKSTWKKSSS